MQSAASFALRCKPIVKLFCRFLLVFLGGGEALRLFATNGALPNVISTVIVPHRPQLSPACCALATETGVGVGCCSVRFLSGFDREDEQGEQARETSEFLWL